MSRQQDQESLTPRTNMFAQQGNSKDQKLHPKKSNPNNGSGGVTYSHDYQRLMRLGRRRTLPPTRQATAGDDDYLVRNLHSTISKGSSATRPLLSNSGDRRLSLRTVVRQWLSDTSAALMTQRVDAPTSIVVVSSSEPVAGASQSSNILSHISATPITSRLSGSQVVGATASLISGLNSQPASRTIAPVSRSFSEISATSLASEAISSPAFSGSVSMISGANTPSGSRAASPVPRTSATQISGTKSLTSVNDPPYNRSATSAAPILSAALTSSRRVPTELKFDLPGRRSMRSTREGDTGPRFTATQIQKLLIIPQDLVTQKDFGKSKAGARIAPPRPPKERHRNGIQIEDAKPKLTVTELQTQFVIPKGLVTQKQQGKKAPGRTANSFANGSYTGRLVEMMHYYRSEYSIWANATIREVKLLGSTEPVVIIEIMSISRNMRLQWAKCKVISNNTTKPLFGPGSIRRRSVHDEWVSSGNNDRIEPISLADLKARGRRSGWIATWSGRSGLLDDGLVDITSRSASLSRFGSGRFEGMPTKGKGPGKEWRVFHEMQSRGSDYVRVSRRSSHLSKNTQGLEGDGISGEQGQECNLYSAPAARSGLLPRSLDISVDTSQFKGLSDSGEAALAKDRDEQDMEMGEIKFKGTVDAEVQVVSALDRTVSVASSIDGGSSDSGELQVLVPLNPLRGTGKQQKETTTSSSMTAEPGTTLDIIFSNLFNHSTLKVADRVEIHEPYRPVAFFESDHAECVWIVERYVVEWQKFSF
ncbi:hypothetical protein BGZ47_003873 [Haplosporangium gracile]|nr:hypothetical protein BGZ47_003873 [Haplosporangium gracile]